MWKSVLAQNYPAQAQLVGQTISPSSNGFPSPTGNMVLKPPTPLWKGSIKPQILDLECEM